MADVRRLPFLVGFSQNEAGGPIWVTGLHLNEAYLSSVLVPDQDVIVGEVFRQECVGDASLGQFRTADIQSAMFASRDNWSAIGCTADKA